MLSPRRWRLATRVTVAVALLLVPLLLLELFTYRQTAEERRRSEIENAAVVANTVATVVDGFGRDIEGTFLVAALSLGDRAQLDQAALGPFLDQLVRQYAVMRAIFVTDLEGRVVASQAATGVGVNLAGRPYVEALKAGAETYWSTGFAGSESGEVTIAFARTIPGPNGVRGFLIAAFYPPSLLERRFSLVLPADGDVTFLDRNGLVLHSTARGPVPAAERNAAGAPRVAEALAGRTALVEADATPFGEEPRYGALVPVPRVGWVVSFTRPRAGLDAALQRQLLEQAVFSSLIVGIFAAAMAWVTRRLVRPLSQLVGTAAAIARGERPALVVSHTGDPEVVQLAEAMLVMSRAVAEREDALGRALAEARRAGDGLRRQSERAAMLADASASLAAASTDLPPALDAVTLHVAEKLGDGCVVMLRGTRERALEVAALYHRAIDPHQVARELVDETLRGTGSEVVRRVFERGQPLLLARPEIGQARILFGAGHARYTSLFAFSGLAAVPIRIAERPIGVLAAWRDVTERPFDPDDQALLQDLADRIGLAIENAGLYEAAQEQANAQMLLNTALREAAEERDRALVAAEDAVRVRDEFLASASHDLKNPLVTVKGAAQIAQRLLRREGDLDRVRLNTLLESVDAAATKLTGQIQELLDVARMRVGHPLELHRRPLDLVELVRAAAAEHQGTTELHQIQVDASEPELRGEWDPRRLTRLLGNLLSNAIKYSPDGGEIRVTVRPERDGARLTVSDSGMGIPAESQAHVFDPFRRGRNVGDIAGTGLGLAGVKAIAEQHGGTVEVRSEEGNGATFTVWLPLRD